MAGRVVGNRLPRWSELQGDLLELILEKLDLAAHARFASVCSSWRSVAVKNPPINKPLYFALSHDPKHLVRRFITSFIPYWNEAQFVGALDGWLVILIDGRNLFLLNKGFDSIIPLPPPPKDFFQIPKFCKAVLSSPPLLSSSSSSSSECTVVIKNLLLVGVLYCRLGSDKSFTKLLDIQDWCVKDILFYKGRLYVLWYDCYLETDNITIFDHLLKKVTQLVANFGIDDPLRRPGDCRLLISENKLLFALCDPVCVFEFEPGESRVIRVENINDKLLLINSFCSLSITPNEHNQFRRNNGFSLIDRYSTFVLDTSEDSNKVKVDDPWPLFFVMFNTFGLHV